MSSEAAIQVLGLSKGYRIHASPRQRLWEAIVPRGRGTTCDHWALRDVSLEVGPGESFGVIGRNGSGKSTLLQCIAGVLQPTCGTVVVRGRLAALLELGTGFNPEFTGRENMRLSAAMLGLSQAEAQASYEEIIAFADIGEFIDQPVKTYSSGMIVRLAFAVQTSVAPDILIVDEALSVGDIFFQQKCLHRMRTLREAGTTILLVSHDMALVRDLTDRAVYLRDGRSTSLGPTHRVIQDYLNQAGGQRRYGSTSASRAATPEIAEILDDAMWRRCEPVGAETHIAAVSVTDESGVVSDSVRLGERLVFRVLYLSYESEPVRIAIVVKNRHDQVVTSQGSYTQAISPPPTTAGRSQVFEMIVRFDVEAGQYTFCARIGVAAPRVNQGLLLDSTDWIGPLVVLWDYEEERAPFLGLFGLPVECKFLEVGAGGPNTQLGESVPN